MNTQHQIYIKGRDVAADTKYDIDNLCNRMYKVKLEDGAAMPTRAHNTDVGYDVKIHSFKYSEDRQTSTKLVLKDNAYVLAETNPIPCYIEVDTGVAIQMDGQDDRAHCICIDAVPNSRMAKPPFLLGNSPGTIDPGYTGTIKLKFNVLPAATWQDIVERFQVGATIGQLKFSVVLTPGLRLVEELDSTDRSDGGFGSTEKTVDTTTDKV